MSGLYSPINKLMEQVARPKGTGAEYMTELQKKPGYKPAEAEDRDLQALMALPQMERAAFMEKFKGQANKFPLKMRELEGRQTHHKQQTLPGGENYREILLHTPMPEGQGFPGVPHHFGGMPNILASIRVKDRASPEGKKILHLEEIQSDWHQQGREKGYLNPKEKHTPEEKKYGIPYGPHAKDWHELALKAMIQHAAENGYDQIAVTPGAEQNKRYGLSAHVDTLHSGKNNDGTWTVAGKKNGKVVFAKEISEKDLSRHVGKDIAEKIIASGRGGKLEGQDLEVGGEGMKGFYDKMVPTFLNKFGKKHGVQVQQGAITTPATNPPNTVQELVNNHGVPVSQIQAMDNAQRNALLDSYRNMQSPVHTFDITPAMREDVLKNGIPRYADGGDVSRETKAKGGEVTMPPSMDTMQYELINRKAK